jgi:hypothetical protein
MTHTKDEALLKALEDIKNNAGNPEKVYQISSAAIKQALAAPTVQEPVALEGGKRLIVVDQSFDDLMYWLDRCEDKGHLENCPDLVEPYSAFQYENYTHQPAAPVPLTDEQITDKNRLDWLNNNFFNRENVDWLTGNVSTESLMWVFFAPTKVQGDIRRVIDAAMDRDNGITKGQP